MVVVRKRQAVADGQQAETSEWKRAIRDEPRIRQKISAVWTTED